MLKNKQKNMKTRSYRMRALNSSEGPYFASLWSSLIIQSPPYLYGTAISQDFKDVIKNTDSTTFKTLTDAGQEIR